jgi:hypothetical protein
VLLSEFGQVQLQVVDELRGDPTRANRVARTLAFVDDDNVESGAAQTPGAR